LRLARTSTGLASGGIPSACALTLANVFFQPRSGRRRRSRVSGFSRKPRGCTAAALAHAGVRIRRYEYAAYAEPSENVLGSIDAIARAIQPNVHQYDVGPFTLSQDDGLVGGDGDRDHRVAEGRKSAFVSSEMKNSSSTINTRKESVPRSGCPRAGFSRSSGPCGGSAASQSLTRNVWVSASIMWKSRLWSQ
jgi:hypothetical protein